jgi:hypothetical protein
MCDWLPLANFIVQICLFGGLVWYTLETRKIRKASQRSADAATDAAKAAVQQALTGQESLRLLKESYEERIGQGPQIVHEAIQRAKSLIGYWKYEATHIAQPPQGNPDPAPLVNSGLLDVLSHARQISPECATLLIEANTALMNAKSELEKAYAASRKQTFMPTPGRAPEYLEQAKSLLDAALSKMPTKS